MPSCRRQWRAAFCPSRRGPLSSGLRFRADRYGVVARRRAALADRDVPVAGRGRVVADGLVLATIDGVGIARDLIAVACYRVVVAGNLVVIAGHDVRIAGNEVIVAVHLVALAEHGVVGAAIENGDAVAEHAVVAACAGIVAFADGDVLRPARGRVAYSYRVLAGCKGACTQRRRAAAAGIGTCAEGQSLALLAFAPLPMAIASLCPVVAGVPPVPAPAC